jgi:hypothetical protein
MERRLGAEGKMQETINVSTSAGGRKPTLAAFNIIERPGLEKPIWSRIGSAWVNRDGSFSVVLDSFPLGGKIHLREDKFEGTKRGPLGRAADAAEPG